MSKEKFNISEVKAVLDILNRNASLYSVEKLTLAESLEIIDRFKDDESTLQCAICHTKIPFLKQGKFYFHHLIPLTMGRENEESNVVPICGYCYVSINH